MGRFRILAALGQGGFGTVYRAHDPVLDREVALKVPRLGTSGAERLILEARAAAPLRHPNLVAVYEAGADGDDLFIATEFVEGETLAEYCQAKPVELRAAATWVRDLAEGLAYAHREGVVHRDVKPSNVMIGASGRAQLMDFGLAQAIGLSGPMPDTEVSPASGRGTSIAGTPAYMSPEQARGESSRVGPASDQYSLGAVLYELMTGKPPFDSNAETVARVASGEAPTPPRRIRPGLPRDLEAICLKAMAQDPADRYVGCEALAEDLRRWLNDELVSARRYSPLELARYWARKRPALFGWTTAAALLAALLLGSGAAYGVHVLTVEAPSSKSDADAVSIETPAKSVEATIPDSSQADGDRLSEMHQYGRLLDRTRMAYHDRDVVLADRWLEQARWDFRDWEYRYLRRLVTGGWKTINGHSGEITALAIHPNGRQFASASLDGSLCVWDMATGEPIRQFRSNQTVTSLAYHPEGTVLAVATGVAGEQPQPMMMMAAPVAAAPAAPAPPGGAAPAAVVAATPARPRVGPHYVVSLRNAETLAEVATYREHTAPIASIAFSPDGRLIASGGAGSSSPAVQQPGGGPQGPTGPYAPSTVRLWNAKTLETERELASPGGEVRRLAFTPDGHRVAATTAGSVLVWNLDPNAAAAVMPGPRPSVFPAVMPVPAAPATDDAPAVAELPKSAEPQPSAPNPSDQSPPAPPTLTGPLMPEQQFFGAHAALAINPQFNGQLIAAPSMDVRLLEQGRRRVAGNEGVLHRWPFHIGAESADLRGEPASILDLAVPAEGSGFGTLPVAAAGGDALLRSRPGTVMLHDPAYEYGGHVAHLGHTAAVTAVAFRPDGRQFVSGGADGVLKIWSAEVHPEVVRLPVQPSATRVAVGRDGRYVAVGGRSAYWTESRGFVSMPGPNGEPVLAAKARGTVKLCDIRSGKELLTLTSGPGDVLGLAVDPDLKWVAAGGEDRQVHLWELASGRPRFEAKAPGVVRCLAVSRDGRYIAAACGSRSPYASDNPSQGGAPARALPAPAPAPPAPVTPAPAAPAPVRPTPPAAAATEQRGGDQQGSAHFVHLLDEDPVPQRPAAEEGTIVLWRTDTGEQTAQWKAHVGDTLSVAFSPDGTHLVSSGADRAVKLWSVDGKGEPRTLQSFDGEIVDLAFRPTGEEIAGAGFDPCRPDKPGEAVVWTVKDGTQRLRVASLSGLMHGVTWSPDGRRFVTSGGAWHGSLSRPGEVRVWDAETGIELLPLAGRPGRAQKTEQHYITREYVVKVPVTKMVNKAIMREGKAVRVCEPVTEYIEEKKTRSETIGGHVQWEEPGAVLGIAFSGDGRAIAAACEDGSALVWDAAIDQPHDSTRWANGRLVCAAASADGRFIATAGDGGNYCDCQGLIRVYDAVTGRLAREIVTPTGTVTDVAFTPDSRRVVTRGGCGAWMPASCGCGADASPPRPSIVQQFMQQRQTANEAGRSEVWDVETGKRLCEIAASGASIVQIAVHPKSGQVLAACNDSSVILADSETGKELRRWKEIGPVIAVRFAPDGRQFAVATSEGEIWLGDPESEAKPTALEKIAGLTDAIFDPSGKRVVAVSWQGESPIAVTPEGASSPDILRPELVPVGTLSTFDLSKEGAPTRVALPVAPTRVVWIPRTESLAVGLEQFSNSRNVAIIDAGDGSKRATLTGHRDAARPIALPDGRVASVGQDQQLKVWRAAAMQRPATESGSFPELRLRTVTLGNSANVSLRKIRFSRDGRIAAAAGAAVRPSPPVTLAPGDKPPPAPPPKYDGKVFLHDAVSGRLVDTVTIPDSLGIPFDLSPEARYIALTKMEAGAPPWSANGIAVLWDREAQKQVAECAGHKGPILAIAFAPDGKRFATAGQDGFVRVWSLTGEELFALKHADRVTSITIDPSGRLLAAGDQGRTVHLWDLEKRETLHKLGGHYGALADVSFSGDGTRLASTSYAWANDGWVGDLKVWDVATGKRTLSIPSHTWSHAGIAFHPTLPRIATTGKGHTLQMFDAETGQILMTVPTRGYECSSVAFSPDGRRILAPLGGIPKLIDASPEPAPFGNASAPAVKQSPEESAAARWVLEHGGQVQVLLDGIVPVDIGKLDDLPEDPYVVRRITLAHRDDVTDADFARFAPLARLQGLWLINLKKTTEKGLPDFSKFSELTSLNLEGLPVTGACLAPFRGVKRLTYLNLSGTQLNDSAAAQLAGNEIAELYLSGAPIGDASAPMLRAVSVGQLNLSRTKLTGTGLKALKGCRAKNCWFDETAINDAGLKEFLSGNPPLEVLSLARTFVTDAVVDDLSRAKSLKVLKLNETAISNDGAAKLRSALPGCQIEHSFRAPPLPGPAGLPQPVGYWNFDDPAQLGRDLAADPIHGKVDKGIEAVDGAIGKGARFRGKYSAIHCANGSKFLQPGPFTMCCWAKWEGNAESKNCRILGQWTPKASDWQLWQTDQGWGGNMRLNIGTAAPVPVGSYTKLSGDAWHHLTWRFDGRSVTLFLDGRPARDLPIEKAKPVVEALGKEGRIADPVTRAPVEAEFLIGSNYQGVIDEVRLYDRSLTNDEVERLANWKPE
ncbi:MAG: protein kinase [Planctomycetaceae bacterium]|nr:protein kinase [Planctomycetaceae bacterium]